MLNKWVGLFVIGGFTLAGGPTLRENPGACRVVTTLTGAAVGDAAGGVLVDQHENNPDNGETRGRTNA
jgi:hypothetical protein